RIAAAAGRRVAVEQRVEDQQRVILHAERAEGAARRAAIVGETAAQDRRRPLAESVDRAAGHVLPARRTPVAGEDAVEDAQIGETVLEDRATAVGDGVARQVGSRT